MPKESHAPQLEVLRPQFSFLPTISTRQLFNLTIVIVFLNKIEWLRLPACPHPSFSHWPINIRSPNGCRVWPTSRSCLSTRDLYQIATSISSSSSSRVATTGWLSITNEHSAAFGSSTDGTFTWRFFVGADVPTFSLPLFRAWPPPCPLPIAWTPSVLTSAYFFFFTKVEVPGSIGTICSSSAACRVLYSERMTCQQMLIIRKTVQPLVPISFFEMNIPESLVDIRPEFGLGCLTLQPRRYLI